MESKTPITKKTRSSSFIIIGLFLLGLSMYHIHHRPKEQLRCPIPLPNVNPVAENRAQLKSKLNVGLVLLESAPKLERLGSDMELPGWRQTSNIMYVLGKYDIPNSFVLINTTCTLLCVSVFLPQLSEREIIFNGAEVNKVKVQRDFYLEQVYDIDQLPRIIKGQSVYATSKNTWESLPKEIQVSINEQRAKVEYREAVQQSFIQSRFIKTKAELSLMWYASQTAMFSHNVIGKYIEESSILTESQTAKYFEYVSSLCGSNLQAYNPIVGCGEHAGVLHFPTGETIDGGSVDIGQKDFILIDAAGAYNGYASDITRTYARQSSKKLRLLSSIVLKSQQAGIEAHRYGNKVIDINLVV
jgi:Xaa-Pro aminopeptidase